VPSRNVVSVVFDTVVFVCGLINPYSFWGRLIFEHATAYRLGVSREVVTEVLEVIQRPRIVRKYRSVATRDMGAVLSLLGGAEVVDLDEIPEVARDHKDDKFLATAGQAKAEYLVSEDEDLLVLGE